MAKSLELFHCRHCKTQPDSVIKKMSRRKHHRLYIYDSSYHKAWLTWTHLVNKIHIIMSVITKPTGAVFSTGCSFKTIIIFSWGIWEACCDQSSTCVPCMGDYDKVRTTIQTIRVRADWESKLNSLVTASSCGNVSIRSETGSTCCSWRHQIIHLEAVETHRCSKMFGWNQTEKLADSVASF